MVKSGKAVITIYIYQMRGKIDDLKAEMILKRNWKLLTYTGLKWNEAWKMEINEAIYTKKALVMKYEKPCLTMTILAIVTN